MIDPSTYLQQVGLKSLGYDPGPLDGVAGPLTRAARAAWLAARTAAEAKPGQLAEKLIPIALGELNVREVTANQGPGIRKYWTATSYPDGYENREPYCAAFVCWLIAQARALSSGAPVFTLPTSPVAYDFISWCRANSGKGVVPIDPAATLLPGDLVIFTFSHIGVVEKTSSSGSVATVEANTDPAGTGNEGGGVYRRQRSRSLIRAVIRITA